MSNITDIVEFYKANKISDRTFEAEIAREMDQIFNISVKIDPNTQVGMTNGSYITMLVPENVNGVYKNTLVIDKAAIYNTFEPEDIDYICRTAANVAPKVNKIMADFLSKRAGSEVSYLETIALYLSIYLEFIKVLVTNSSFSKFIDMKTIDFTKLDDLSLAINNATENKERILEFIAVNKLLPEFAIERAENMFKLLNGAEFSGSKNGDTPIENYLYTKLSAIASSAFNPLGHTALDPTNPIKK